MFHKQSKHLDKGLDHDQKVCYPIPLSVWCNVHVPLKLKFLTFEKCLDLGLLLWRKNMCSENFPDKFRKFNIHNFLIFSDKFFGAASW
jgi:hypothetical protein